MSIEDGAAGDLHDPTASPAETARRMSRMLCDEHPGARITVVSRTTSTDSTIEVAIVEHPVDLGDEKARRDLLDAVTLAAGRFAHDRSVPQADHEEREFRIRVMIHEDYWSRRQSRALPSGWRPLSPSAFMSDLRRGHVLMDMETGARHTVMTVSNGRFETETDGPATRRRWAAPRAAALLIRNGRIRMALGSANQPDAAIELEIRKP